jgi:ankyrin repeat protein
MDILYNQLLAKKIFDELKSIDDQYNFLIASPCIHYLLSSKNRFDLIKRVIKNGEVDILETAIINGLDINRIKYHSLIILELAIYYEQIDIIKLLIEYGIKKEVVSLGTNNDYPTIKLFFDLSHCNYEYTRHESKALNRIIQSLYLTKDNLNHFIPRIYSDVKEASYLTKCDIDFFIPPLYSAVKRSNNLEIVKLLVEAGFPINYKSKFYPSALSMAILYDNIEIVEYLLDHGAEINSNSDDFLMTPIGIAIEHKRIEILKLLVSKGADLEKSVTNTKILKPITFLRNKFMEFYNNRTLSFSELITKIVVDPNEFFNYWACKKSFTKFYTEEHIYTFYSIDYESPDDDDGSSGYDS